MIQPIVEGDGEVKAVPVLLRRLIPLLCEKYIEVNRPIRSKRTQMVREEDFRKTLKLARVNQNNNAIIVIFDLDDDCARDLIPKMYEWASQELTNLPHAIVAARREYEAWFLASIESLRGRRDILDDAIYTGNPESKRGAKEALTALMPRNKSYVEKDDQAALTSEFDFVMAHQRASSFRKLTKEVVRLLAELGYEPHTPHEW